MTWNASLELDYTVRQSMGGNKTVAHFQRQGPLRILQSLYPEGQGICHNVLIHPPGGLAGGDTANLRLNVATGAHGLVTTPGATRFYRTEGEPALQSTAITLAAHAQMEWLPLETIAFSCCAAENRLTLSLEPDAEMIGWDMTALGLPAANKPFEAGVFSQHLELPGVWLERACIQANDHLLLDSAMGLAGQRCFATLFFVSGSPLAKARRQDLLDAARSVMDAPALRHLVETGQLTAGATSPNPQVVLVRAIAPVVEPAMTMLRDVWQHWRSHLWGVRGAPPRIWST